VSAFIVESGMTIMVIYYRSKIKNHSETGFAHNYFFSFMTHFPTFTTKFCFSFYSHIKEEALCVFLCSNFLLI